MNTQEFGIDRSESWFDVEDSGRSPEQKLWVAVLARALLDALGCSNTPDPTTRQHEVNQAQYFFTGPSAAYMRTCASANVDGKQLRRHVLPMIESYQKNGQQPDFVVQRRLAGRRAAA